MPENHGHYRAVGNPFPTVEVHGRQERVPDAASNRRDKTAKNVKNNKAKPISGKFNATIPFQGKSGRFRSKIESKTLSILQVLLGARGQMRIRRGRTAHIAPLKGCATNQKWMKKKGDGIAPSPLVIGRLPRNSGRSLFRVDELLRVIKRGQLLASSLFDHLIPGVTFPHAENVIFKILANLRVTGKADRERVGSV